MGDYAAIVDELIASHGLRVRRWRDDHTGCAWRTTGMDGEPINWIESPYPTDPLTFAIFLHEVGHHAIGLDAHTLESEAEYWAWQWAFDQMRARGIRPDRNVCARYELALRYAVYEEIRRENRHLPAFLTAFLPRAA